MSAPSEFHNLLAARFVREVIGPAIKNGATYAQLMVLFESCQLGVMESLVRHYELAPHVAAGLVEASVQATLERFTELRKGGA